MNFKLPVGAWRGALPEGRPERCEVSQLALLVVDGATQGRWQLLSAAAVTGGVAGLAIYYTAIGGVYSAGFSVPLKIMQAFDVGKDLSVVGLNLVGCISQEGNTARLPADACCLRLMFAACVRSAAAVPPPWRQAAHSP